MQIDLSGLPIAQMGVVKTKDMVFDPEVRHMCEANSCGVFGKSWSCPPAIGTYEECRGGVLAYDEGLVFNTISELKDSYDWRGMMDALSEFRSLCEKIRERAEASQTEYRLFAAGQCQVCKKCTYPDAPCRFPDKALESVEGQGLLVNELAASAGINYISGQNTVTYIGMLLYKTN